MFVVIVTFQIRDGRMPDFLPAMIENARTSLAEEEGCHRFDVCTDSERGNEVFLYELYTDRAAFDGHLQSAHFKAFDNAVSSLVGHKDIRTYDMVAS
ncbi:putative quinol monooxygenase [Algicella marina]|uniref:Antibiotic biosynthesis monooxygenase n=1 Tax=Algicella marina TaxID=2683284 RepID=A0A6P1T3I9_9RHOB|nr:putative quinol monooxygenase [Algicella marina]QHQ36305.1 antibiotic biosynthesis monooxygenase [Algicella marina]